MSLSICDHCGYHISLNPCSLNRCIGCGLGMIQHDPLPPVGGIDDSELVALRAEVARLKKEVEEKMWDVVSWGHKYERVLCELVEVKKERDELKKEVEEEQNHYKSLQQLADEQVAALREDVKLWKEKETARYCEYTEAIGDRNALMKENEARRWECLEWQQKHDALLMGLRK